MYARHQALSTVLRLRALLPQRVDLPNLGVIDGTAI